MSDSLTRNVADDAAQRAGAGKSSQLSTTQPVPLVMAVGGTEKPVRKASASQDCELFQETLPAFNTCLPLTFLILIKATFYLAVQRTIRFLLLPV